MILELVEYSHFFTIVMEKYLSDDSQDENIGWSMFKESKEKI